nr:PTS sugar transporter subunit IIA [uncultured Anaerostipes sp.]
MLDLDYIYLDADLSSRKEIFCFIKEELFKRGFVKDMYAEALEQREEQSPTGLATIPYGIAIPHTDPEYVIAPCIVVIRLKQNVQFEQMGGAGETVGARFIFGLAFTDGKKQIELLAGIIALAQNQEDMEVLRCSNSKEKILNTIKKYVT